MPGLEITITPPGPIDADLVAAYAEAGVERLIVEPHPSTAAATDDLNATTVALWAHNRDAGPPGTGPRRRRGFPPWPH